MNLFDMTGRVGVVTGAAQGMGKAMATAWAEAGADVVLVDRNAEGLEATASDIRALGRRAVPFTCDLADLSQIDLLWAKVDAEFGRVDCVGNVAGDARAGAPETASIEDLQFTLQCLVVSKFYMCQHAGKRMLAQGKGECLGSRSWACLLFDGHGCGGPDDPGTEYRMGKWWRAGQCDPAGTGRESWPSGSHGCRSQPCWALLERHSRRTPWHPVGHQGTFHFPGV